MQLARLTATAATLTAALATAHAGISQSTIAAPGGFMQAGAYSQTSSGITPGRDLAASIGTPQDFHEQDFSGVASARAAASYAADPISNNARGDAALGIARFYAFNASPDSAHFPVGIANGGWADTFTVSAPGLAGQPGYLVFHLRARGTMHTTGRSGSVKIEVTAFKDHQQLLTNPYYDRGTSDPSGGSYQWIVWALASPGSVGPLDRAVDGAATFSVPIIFGQPFTLGVFADARAGLRSSGSSASPSSGSIDFSAAGITWNGIDAVRTAAGAPVSGYTVTSGSGLDWSGPVEPCRADLTGDGLLDFTDYLEFLNRYESLDPSADLSGDGLIDFSDYLEFLSLYDAGC